MQYTIEARELRSESTPELRRRTIEANNDAEALDRFVREERSELVSLTRPARGGESIATVRKEDVVFLVRVYAG